MVTVPWCNSKLPSDLTTELMVTIYKELGLEGYDDPRVPKEYKSDKWWKSRGL